MDDKNLQYLNPLFKDGHEKIEAIEHILYKVSKYIRSPEELSDNFVNYIDLAISQILRHTNISGQKGDELASDLIFRCAKLFMNFTQKRLSSKKSVATKLFSLIRRIFDKYYDYDFFISKIKDDSIIKTTHKGLTYEDYNKFFEADFEKKKVKIQDFKDGALIDIYAEKKELGGKICKKAWVWGKISGIDKEPDKSIYDVVYYQSDNKNSKVGHRYSNSSLEIEKKGTKTEYLDNRIKLYKAEEKTLVDYCFEKNNEKIWCIAKICDIENETKDDDLKFLKYKLELDNYDNNFVNEKEYGFYDGMDQKGIYISFDSYRIQKFKTFSDVQKKYFKLLKEKKKELADNYKSLLDFVLELLENDQNIEDFYDYEKTDKEDGSKKINYILGKYHKNYSFYFTKLLKAMADNEHFKIIIDILKIYKDEDKDKNKDEVKEKDKDKDKNKSNNDSPPTIDEISTFFCILLNCTPFIHKKYYEDNYDVFKNAVSGVIKNESEKNNMTKSIVYFYAFFLIKIDFLINKLTVDRCDESFNLNTKIDVLLLGLGLELMKSETFKVRDIGLDMILECANYSLDEEENISIINTLTGQKKDESDKSDKKENKNEDFMNLLFKKEYQTAFIIKSYTIIKLLLKYKKLDQNKLELIWNLVNEKNGDLELENAVIELFNIIYEDLDSEICNKLLDIIKKGDKIQKIDSLYILKNKLALKAKSDDTIENVKIECCNYFTKKILEEEDLKKLKDNEFLKEVIKYFSFGEKFYIKIIQQYIDNICELIQGKKNNENKDNILVIISSFHKILEKQDTSEVFQKLFKEQKISLGNKSLDEQSFIDLFEKIYSRYKKLVQAQIFNKKVDENENEINESKNNIKIFIDFLMKVLPDICQNQDYIDLLKKMSLDEPIDETNTQIFYDYAEMFVNDKNRYRDDDYKRRKELQIFDIINNKTNKSNMTLKQIKLYITIFCDINKYTLSREGEKLKLKENINISIIPGLKDLWNMYLSINIEELSKELYLFIYDLYNNNNECETLLDICLKGILELNYINVNDEELDKNDNKLSQYINMINYIITKSEEGKIIPIKSHRDLLKECVMNIPIILNNDKMNKFDKSIEEKIDLFYGNANLSELNKILHKKYDNNASNIYIKIIDKNGNPVQKSLNSTLNSIRENSEQIIFVGKEVKSIPFETNKVMNSKFKIMLEEWFNYFSNNKKEMNEEDINKFKEEINNKEIIIDNNNEIKSITKEDFIKLYEKLSRDEPDFVLENIKKMKYLTNFEKIQENKMEEVHERKNLKKYILGNNNNLYNSLLKIFSKTKKKCLVYDFLNTLYTNEKIYDEVLNNFEKVSEKEEKNSLQYIYELSIIESIIQDLDIGQLDVNNIFCIKKDDGSDKIHFEKYLPFDADESLEIKKNFMLTFIKKGNNYLGKLLDELGKIFSEQNEIDLDFYNELFIKIFKIVDFMQNIYNQKLFYEINDVINSVYVLNGHNKINKDKIFGSNIKIEDEEISNFNIIILKLFNIFFNHKSIFDEKTYKYTFSILLNTKNFEETLPGETKIEMDDDGNEEEVESDELAIFDLLNDNINNINNVKYMTSFEKYVERLSSLKKEYNTDIEDTSIINELAPTVIMNIITNFFEIDFDNLDSNANYLLFFGNIIRLFSVNVDILPLEQIITYIEQFLKEKNYLEKLYFGLISLLAALLSRNKKETLKNFGKRINNIYEEIKKIILNENIINKVKMKLDELKKNKNKMLPSKEIKEFFKYVNNKTEGENILEQTFLMYKNFIISYCDNSSLAKIIKELLENIEDFKEKKDSSSQGKIMGLMGLVKNENVFYINSILQQLNQISILRDAIISLDIEQEFAHNEMIKELQKIFLYMKYSENKIYDSNTFCFGFIEEMFSLDKREGVTFLELLFRKMEESLKTTKYKYIIEDTFQITECISSRCLECGYIEDRFEKFKFLTLDIKGYKNLREALKYRFSENKINTVCKKCGRNTKKIRRSSISKLPNVIIFHLDRIHENYEYGGKLVEKIDDKFEFNMQQIDFKDKNNYKNLCTEIDEDFEMRENSNKIYSRENEYYKYNMKGIINYNGNAEKGDYYSLIKLANKNWIQFFDEDYSSMDEETVKLLSFGNKDEFGLPSAYFLIYEREKEYPIRILDKEKTNEKIETFDNNYISFDENTKDDIDKKYDTSRVLDDDEGNIDLKKLVFHDKNLNETFSKLTYKEMETQIPKILFIVTIEENNKYFRKNDIDEYKKCEFKFRLIILDAINSKDFFLFDNKDFNLNDIKKLIYFFNKQIFQDKLNEIKNINLSENDEKNKDFKKYINIFIEKLLIPMLDKKEKTNEIYELISIVAKILLTEDNIKLLLEFDKNKRIFDSETVKKFLKVIHKIIFNLIDKENYSKTFNFKGFFNTFFNSIIKYNNDNILNSLSLNDDEHVHHNLLDLYENIKDLITLNKDIFTLEINVLLEELDKIKYKDLRKIICEIISILIKNDDNNKQLKNIYQILDEKLLKKIFNEDPELLSEIIIRINYKEYKERNHFNEIVIPFLFNYALKSNQIKQLMDLLYKIINIKDEFTLERLYLIMGFPQMIIERQNIYEEYEEKEDEEGTEKKTTIHEQKSFWPRFGIPLIKKNESDEIYKYISNIKIYESHCILAQLFPCTDFDYYDNNEFLEEEEELEENDIKVYIYKLLCLALLNEGNYCLFKYIYLTQSRFIVRYNNLYEEMIQILSKDEKNKFDLSEIQKNAEICIKRINYEIGNIKKEELNAIPELPENMKKNFIEFNDVKEFTGFIPKHLPDKISKVVYTAIQRDRNYMIISLNYYTTYKDLEIFRNENRGKTVENKENEEEKNDIIEEKKEDIDLATFKVSNTEIGKNENEFLYKIYLMYEDFEKNIQIIDDSLDNKKPIKSSLIRHIYYNNMNIKQLLKDKASQDEISDKSNYFLSQFWNIDNINEKDYCEIFNVYRKNFDLEFINGIKISHSTVTLNKNKISFSTESYFHDENN